MSGWIVQTQTFLARMQTEDKEGGLAQPECVIADFEVRGMCVECSFCHKNHQNSNWKTYFRDCSIS